MRSSRRSLPDKMAQLIGLYQSINRSLMELDAVTEKTGATNRSAPGETKVRRDAQSFWCAPTYRQVLDSLRAGQPQPFRHRFDSTMDTTHRRAGIGFSGDRPAGSMRYTYAKQANPETNKYRKSQRKVSINIIPSVASTDRGTVQGTTRRAVRKRVQLETAYSKRSSLLSQIAGELCLDYDGVVQMFKSMSSFIISLDMSTAAGHDRYHGSSAVDQNFKMLAHTFLEMLGKLLSAHALEKGLDEAVFVNFDVNFEGTIDIREFCLELSASRQIGLSIPQIVSLLFLMYGVERQRGKESMHLHTNTEISKTEAHIRKISVIRLTNLMNRGRESSRSIIATTERFLSALDADGDGIITWNEFISAVLNDSSILDSFRNAYSVTSRAQMLSVMMFSPLNRFIRRCKLDWGMLAKMASHLYMAGERYKIVKDERVNENSVSGISGVHQNGSVDSNTKDAGSNFDHVLIDYYQFRDIIFPFMGNVKPSDSAIISDLFDIAAAESAEDKHNYHDRKGRPVRVADVHRFIIDLSSALEDLTPSTEIYSVKRAQFYFQLLDLDHNGTIDYDEVYEVVSLGQPSGSAKYILHGRKLMRDLRRDVDGYVSEADLVEACTKTPALLWQIVQRYNSSS